MKRADGDRETFNLRLPYSSYPPLDFVTSLCAQSLDQA